jgi:hypothetical protein
MGNPFKTIDAEFQCWIRLLNTAFVQTHLLTSVNSVNAVHLAQGTNHFASVRAIRQSSHSHDHASLKTTMISLENLLRSKVIVPAAGQQQQIPIEAQFVPPSRGSWRNQKFNTPQGVQLRCDTSQHLPEVSTRAECFICCNISTTICVKCNVVL